MALLACLEEESEMLKFYKKYPEESLEMLFPLFALYYKMGNDKKAKSYLNKINKVNKYFIKYFNDTLEQAYDAPKGYYLLGKPSEIFMYFNNYEFLINTIPAIDTITYLNTVKSHNVSISETFFLSITSLKLVTI